MQMEGTVDFAMKPFAPMPPPKATPARPAVFIPSNLLPQGEGEFKIQMGRPLEWLTTRQLAGAIGVDHRTVNRWKNDGTIAKRFVKLAGKRKMLFNAGVIEDLAKLFKRLH